MTQKILPRSLKAALNRMMLYAYNFIYRKYSSYRKTSIDFSQGLNVLTGETGAGKSIIIDSINAIMGQRTSKELVRTGAKPHL